ncbi:hypothetical protein [Amycolatopsis sp. cg9]|uniref:hypothetical protein n=1 Tax=Amycolatopsis sp. cg9 TaxID=3238801 RepID=UPI003525056F
MTVPIRRVPDPATPQAVFLRRAFEFHDAAGAAMRRARLLRVAYWVSGPFPGATELIVTMGEVDGELALTAVKDTEGHRWTDDGGVSTCPDDYRTTDGATLDQLVEDIESELDALVGDNDPRRFWEQLTDNVYRVTLPAPGDLGRLTSGAAEAAARCSDVLSHIEVLGRLRDHLDRIRTRHSARRRDRAAGAATVIDEISAAVAELEHAAITEQHRLRLEVVVDRDPDAGTEVAAFLDGVPHPAEVTVVDPGAGHRLADWRETGRGLADKASPNAAARIRGCFAAYEDNEFITG